MIHVKLGEKASMFFDPTTKVKVLPNQAVPVSNREKESKKFKRAIAAGHLERVSEDEANKINSKQSKRVAKILGESKTESAGKGKKDDEVEDKPVEKMNKGELVAHAVKNGMGTKEEMEDLNKPDLLDHILTYNDEDEDDEDEDEDDEDEDDEDDEDEDEDEDEDDK